MIRVFPKRGRCGKAHCQASPKHSEEGEEAHDAVVSEATAQQASEGTDTKPPMEQMHQQTRQKVNESVRVSLLFPLMCCLAGFGHKCCRSSADATYSSSNVVWNTEQYHLGVRARSLYSIGSMDCGTETAASIRNARPFWRPVPQTLAMVRL